MKHQIFAYSVGIVLLFAPAAQAQLMQPEPDAVPGDSLQEPMVLPEESSESVEVEGSGDVGEDVPTLNLPQEVIDESPVLQRWLEDVPDVRDDIHNDPSFKTRVQLGYSYFPSSNGTSGIFVGVDDVFLGKTPLTLSADYQDNFESGEDARTAYGADLHYYVLPLGGYFNVSPIVGYRHADSGADYNVDGVNLGARLRFVPSRTAAADITLDQSWIVGDSEGLSVTHVNLGYAITPDLRLSTDFEWQSTPDEGDSRVGVNLEWAF